MCLLFQNSQPGPRTHAELALPPPHLVGALLSTPAVLFHITVASESGSQPGTWEGERGKLEQREGGQSCRPGLFRGWLARVDLRQTGQRRGRRLTMCFESEVETNWLGVTQHPFFPSSLLAKPQFHLGVQPSPRDSRRLTMSPHWWTISGIRISIRMHMGPHSSQREVS